MTAIRLANAPCSWGALEFETGQHQRIDYAQMLDELRASGYVGTELGDWGFLPTEPTALAGELRRRDLAMAGAFVPVALRRAEAHAEGVARAVRTAGLLRAVADLELPPLLVLADESCSDPMRTLEAGRVTPALGLSGSEWQVFTRGAERIARAVLDATGLRTAFHPHCAGFVETLAETARLLELTDPTLVGLTFDTGHVAYGSGRDDAGPAVLEGLERFGDRVWHVHVKDCDPAVAARARSERWDYHRAVRDGLFCELGRGLVDFPAFLDRLRARGYRGWIVVEQDVLPGLGTPLQSAERNRAYLASLNL